MLFQAAYGGELFARLERVFGAPWVASASHSSVGGGGDALRLDVRR